jgi:hypothetical protein
MLIEVENIYVDEKTVAKIRNRSVQSLRNDRCLGRGLPYVKDGRLVRYFLPDVYADMESKKINPGCKNKNTEYKQVKS